MSFVSLAARIVDQFGITPRKTVNSVLGIPYFIRDLLKYKRMARGNVALKISTYYPVLHERASSNGHLNSHYLWADLWAARKIYKNNPARHVDVGSSITGFICHLLTFRDVEVLDVRPLDQFVPGLTFTVGDATNMSAYEDNSLESVSTLHAGEHFGLGRYGDPVDPEAHTKFMASLARVVKPGGKIYYAVPCGVERIYFNAHRVISPHTIINGFGPTVKLVNFSCVTDDNKFHENCDLAVIERENFGCGLFEFTKP